MNFMDRHGWRVCFLEADCRTELPLRLTFAHEEKIRALYDRCGAHTLEEKQALELGLGQGRGSAWLTLTGVQYQALRRKEL